MFNQPQTALSQEEREAIARKNGICVKCGVKTHDVKMFKRVALTNDHVFEGICIRDNGGMVPPKVCQASVVASGPSRLRTPARVAQVTANSRRNNVGRPTPTSQRSNHGRDRPRDAHGRERAPPQNNDGPTQRNYQHTAQLRPREAPRPTLNASTSDVTSSTSSTNTKSSNLQSSTGSRGSAVAMGSEIINEDYTGGNSTEDAWQIVKAMRDDNKGKPDILKLKLHRLRNLGDDQTGALYEIKEVMDQYRNEPRVMAAACGALWGVTALNDDKKAEAGTSGALDNIVDGLRSAMSSRDADFVQWATGTLACISRGIDNRQNVADAGAIEAIIETMREHYASAGVFEWSCRALHTFVHQYENEGDDEHTANAAVAIRKNIVTIDDADGIEVIVEQMKNHTSEHIAQLWAMRLLWRLQDRGDENASRRLLQKMRDKGAALACIRVIKARSTTLPVFALTTGLLHNILAVGNESDIPDQASDCLLTVVRKMNEARDDEALQESCLVLLRVMVGSGRLQMKESNGMQAVVSAMTRFPNNLSIQQAGANVLWRLSYITAFFDFSCLRQAMTAIEAASKHHMDDAEFLSNACGFIANAAISTSEPVSGLPFMLPLNALSKHSNDPVVADQAARALGNLCAESETIVRRVVEANGIQILIEGLNCDSDSARQSVLGALVNVAGANDENKRRLVTAKCLDAAKGQVQRSSSPGVVEKALELMSSMVTTQKRSAMQLPADIFQVIMNAMKTKLSGPAHQERACGVMRNLLVVSTPGSTSLKFDGIVDFMSGIVDLTANPVELKREACGVLWALTARHSKQSSAHLAKMFRSVLAVMGHHKGEGKGNTYDSDLQSMAAGALASITGCLRDTSIHIANEDVEELIAVMYMAMEFDLNRTELMEKFLDAVLNLSFVNEGVVIQCGGIVAVIDAMVEHEQVEQIQERGCAILALLSSTENLQVNLCIAETDGIDMIVSALAVFPTNQRIQVDACKALSHLSVDHESRMLIASQGGLILVVNAMNSNQENVDLLEGACSALLNLSSDAEEQILADSSVVETVVALMKYHPDAPRVQEKALGVLQNVSMRNANAKKAIADVGGISGVAMAMKEHMGSPTVLERAFTTLWSLAVLKGNQVAIANAGEIALVVNGMMATITYDKVQKQACGCLCTLSSNSRNKTLIREAGGVDAIVYAMWAHYDSEMLQIEACRALSSLAVNVQTNEVMIATDGEINAIISAMRRFPDSAKLQEHACVALRNFMLSADNAALIRSNAAELVTLMERASRKFPEKCAERARHVLANLQ